MTSDAQQGLWPNGGPGAPAPATPAAPSPFAGVPVGDYVRDAAAAALLVTSLALPWDYAHDATSRVDVILVTVLSLLSLTLPYLARVGALGPTFTIRAAGTVRLLANAPYLVVVLVYVLIDAVAGADGGGGIGAAAAVGLAGAVLAAQTRVSETGGVPSSADRCWPALLGGLAALLVLLKVISTVVLLTQVGDVVRYGGGITAVLAVLLTSALTLVLVGWPLLGLLRRDGAWRLVVVAVGAPVVLVYLVAQGDGVAAPSVESVHALGPGLVLWPAVAAAAVAPVVRRGVAPVGGRSPWEGAAARTLALATVANAVVALVAVLALVGAYERGRLVLLVVLGALSVVAALIGRSALVVEHGGGRTVVYAGAGALLVLGIVQLVVTASSTLGMVTGTDLVISLVLPVAVLVLLAVPAVQAGRITAPVGGPPTSAPPPAAASTPAPPAAPPVAPPVPAPVVPAPDLDAPPPPPPVSATVRLASDPATPLATLADLAARAPETRVHLARNPATYPALLAWLAALDDAEISAALAEREV